MPNWTSLVTKVGVGTHQYVLLENGTELTFQQVIYYWVTNVDFRGFYHKLLADSPFKAYFWEHPPLSADRLNRNYEMVLVDSKALASVSANPKPFSAFLGKGQLITDFPNLSGDTHLIVPDSSDHSAYPHLAAFCRISPKQQASLLWQHLGVIFLEMIQQQTVWLSTSGLGVYWLHLRLASRPKYYTFAPYREDR